MNDSIGTASARPCRASARQGDEVEARSKYSADGLSAAQPSWTGQNAARKRPTETAQRARLDEPRSHSSRTTHSTRSAGVRTCVAPCMRARATMRPREEYACRIRTDSHQSAACSARHSQTGGALMCGIIGYTGERDAAPLLLDGLQRLEYRGYDSAGIAVIDSGGKIHIAKGAGKLSALRSGLEGAYPAGAPGIGHTRWATHGKPTADNAHPHTDCTRRRRRHPQRHRRELPRAARGTAAPRPRPALRDRHRSRPAPHRVVRRRGRRSADGVPAHDRAASRARTRSSRCPRAEPGTIIAARVGNAGGVVVGYGDGEMFVSSDLAALLPETQRVAFLADGELAELTHSGVRYVDFAGAPLTKEPQHVPFDPISAAKGAYKHFMLKEIMEQPECVHGHVPRPRRVRPARRRTGGAAAAGRRAARASRASCSSAWARACTRRWSAARTSSASPASPAEIDNSSEFRYRDALDRARYARRSRSRSRARPSTRWKRWPTRSGAARPRSRSATRRARRRRASPTACFSRAAGRRSPSPARRR